MTRATLPTALAYVAICDSKRFLHMNTRLAVMDFITVQPGTQHHGQPFYKLTQEGQALAEQSALWKAHQHLLGLGFKLDGTRRHKPGHLVYRHPDQVLTPDQRWLWRCAFTGKRGYVYADQPSEQARCGWAATLVAEYR